MRMIGIRCPGERKHTIHKIEYTICGNSMGGLEEGDYKKIIFRCSSCGFWEVQAHSDDSIDMTKIDTSNGKKIDFITKLRRVHNG